MQPQAELLRKQAMERDVEAYEQHMGMAPAFEMVRDEGPGGEEAHKAVFRFTNRRLPPKVTGYGVIQYLQDDPQSGTPTGSCTSQIGAFAEGPCA